MDEWEWVKRRFPWVAEARPAHELLNALLDWAQPGKELTVYDLRCNGVRVMRRQPERSDGGFEGRIVRDTRFVEGELGLEKWVSVDHVELANRITVYCGNGELYRRGAKGEWLSAGSQGFGCVRELAHGLNPPIQLSRVSTDAAWYAGSWVSYPEECRTQIAEVESCSDGRHRSCLVCREWGPGRSVTPIPTVRTTRRVDCSRPCPALTPPQALAHDVRRARRALDGRHLVRHLDFKPPEVFRTRAACLAYRKEHKDLVVQQTWLDR